MEHSAARMRLNLECVLLRKVVIGYLHPKSCDQLLR